MKSTKLTALLLAILTVTAMVAGCSHTVTIVKSTDDQDATTTTTTPSPAVSTAITTAAQIPDPYTPASTYHPSVKKPIEYVENSSEKAEQEDWILLNEYLEWEEPVLVESSEENGDLPPLGLYTCNFMYMKPGNQYLQIYAVEIIYANNKFDFYGSITFNKHWNSSDTSAQYRVDMVATSPYVYYLDEDTTHSTEHYTDQSKQTPVNSAFIEMVNPILIGYYQGGEIRSSAIPLVNELVEIRLWGKIVEN